MQIASAEEEQRIKSLILEYKDGDSKDFEKIRYMLYDYAYILTKPVFKDDNVSGQIAQHILVRLEENLDKVNLDTDFYSWFSRFCAYRMYRIINGRKGPVIDETKPLLTYSYQNIKDDPHLSEEATRYFDLSLAGDSRKDRFSTIQRLLLEMYVMLEIDIDSISRIFKMDQKVIASEIARIRKELVVETKHHENEKYANEKHANEKHHENEKEQEKGLLQFLFPGVSKKVWTYIDLGAAMILAIAYMIFRL